MKICFFIQFFIFTCFFSPVLIAQQVITGRITDVSDGKPLSYASIYISNTTVKAISDELGNYSITVSGKGSFEIVVSYLGYQPVFHKVDVPKPFHKIDLTLKMSEIKINEVVITAVKSKHKQRDIDLFWRIILGEEPSKKGLEVLNPEKIHYFMGKDNIFTVSCDVPIEILNHHMGYSIKYILQRFQYDYNIKECEYYGTPSFEELIPKNSREKNRWEMKRREAYAVSLNHFLRALYYEQIHEEGFFLAKTYLIKDRNLLTVNLKDIIQKKQDIDIALLTIEASIDLFCISKPVTAQMIDNSYRHIWLKKNNYTNIILKPQQILIYPNGSYYGTFVIGNISSITGLSKLLPFEYTEMQWLNSKTL